MEPVAKKPRADGMDIERWCPPSVANIGDNERFSTTTFRSEIPSEVANHPSEPVVVGVDEAGRGPVLGPMVYGLAYCPQSYHQQLKTKYKFADSKTLADSRRQELFQMIDRSDDELAANVGWATTSMSARDISSGMLRSAGAGAYNLNEQAHDVTIALLTGLVQSGVNVSAVYVDTVGLPHVYQEKLQKIFPHVTVTVAKKADALYPIVSTASVAAKVTRDLNLQWLSRHVTLNSDPLGLGYPSDPSTSRWLASNVDHVFGWHHGLVRFLWLTAKEALIRANAAHVTYEHQCTTDKGYTPVTSMFGSPSGSCATGFYADPVVL